MKRHKTTYKRFTHVDSLIHTHQSKAHNNVYIKAIAFDAFLHLPWSKPWSMTYGHPILHLLWMTIRPYNMDQYGWSAWIAWSAKVIDWQKKI